MQISSNYTSYLNSINRKKVENNIYLKSLEGKYGVSVSVGKITNQAKLEKYAKQCAGSPNPYKNVMIADNIAKQMESNPEIAAKYEGIIKNFSETIENRNKQFIDKHTWSASTAYSKCEIWSSGIVIDENGEVQEWINGVITTVTGIVKDELFTQSSDEKNDDWYNQYIEQRNIRNSEYLNQQNIKSKNFTELKKY